MASKKSSSKKQSKPEAQLNDGLDLPSNLRREPVPAQKVETTTITKPTATPTAEATKKAKPPVKVKAAKAPSMSAALKQIVVLAPKISTDELFAKLEGMGFKGRSRVTVSTLQSDALTTLRAAVAAKLFPKWD